MKEVYLRPDSKGRICIGKMAEGVSGYRAFFDEGTHRIILEPYTEIPYREKWLFSNPEALERVQRGLRESSEGILEDMGSFSEHIK